MAYIIDHARAISDRDLVAIRRVRQRGANSQLVLADGSLVSTRTRLVTFRRVCASRASNTLTEGLLWVNDRSRAR